MIIFKKLTIEGFGSIIEPFDYRMDQPGVNVIFGKNGSGKTTIFSALVWVLYGRTLGGKTIEPWEDIIDNSNYQGTKVTIKLLIDGISFKIIRCKGYKGKIDNIKGSNNIFIYNDRKWLDDLRDKKDQQHKIDEIIGMSFVLFKNSILFGQKLTRLLSETGPTQKGVFEEAFNVPYISTGKKHAENDLVEYLIRSKSMNAELETIEQKIVTNREFIDSLQNTGEKDITSIEADITESEKLINIYKASKGEYKLLVEQEQGYRDELDKIQIKLDDLQELERQHFRKDLNLSGEVSMVDRKKQDIKTMKLSLSSKIKVCEECGQDIDKKEFERQMDSIRNQIKNAKADLKISKNRVKTMKAEIKELESSLTELNSLKDSKDNVTKSLDTLINVGYDTIDYHPVVYKKEKKNLKKLMAKKEKLLNQSDNKEDIDKYLEVETNLKIDKKVLNKDITELDQKIELNRWVINDALSNKGLKNYIFQSQLALVNSAMSNYSKILGYRVKLSIDLESSNKNFIANIYQGREVRDYNSLSGGQQQLVDICLALAIHDVIHKSRTINLLIMDEVFESLDESNISVVSELIGLKSRNLPLHLVTHRKEFLSTKIDNQISVGMSSSGVTELI